MKLATLALALVAGCGLGVHRNPTVAVTAPYHEHQATLEDFSPVTATAKPVAMPSVSVGPFARYYAQPIGFVLGTGAGAMKSWGRGEVTTWSPIVPTVPPEQVVQQTFTSQLGGAGSGDLTLTGVVTDVTWYVFEGGTSTGRITTKIALVRRDGTAAYEGERSTTGRAKNLQDLITAHVATWLADPELVSAVSKGGAQ